MLAASPAVLVALSADLASASHRPPAAPLARAASSSGTPVWLSVLLAFLTLVGVIVSAWFLRRTGKEARTTALELDRRDKREETMRTLR